ncbi:Glycosyltransferase [Quillaja saponaria]|uniref:Glycosyltransferase n=1 Tax=Quillaja saponaria TaxID=32244 RepID=A0AAD7KP14_QUISA|nr:Glycosyltransferase [Quillaja saponaria]
MATPVLHLALIPGAGMGHLRPFLRYARLLVHHQYCRVTLITSHPTLTLEESELISSFCSALPQVNHIQFHLPPVDAATAKVTDPFWLQFEAIRLSDHLLSPLLSSISPPLSAVISDMILTFCLLPITESLCLPNYILFTTSARMLSFLSCFPAVHGSKSSASSASFDGEVLEIPGILPIPKSSISPFLLDPNSRFANIFMEDSLKVPKLNGFLVNTFKELEGQTMEALNGGKVVKGLPPIFSVGPLLPCEFERKDQLGTTLKWLDGQPEGSVVYVCFGSKAAMKRDQIRELGDGLMRSGSRFLWVLKDKPVDRDEEEELDEVVGDDLKESMKKQGLVVSKWVDQGDILGHKAVGGFISHCGWNSITEAAYNGVPILAWPQHGDQKLNSEIVVMSGLGIWMKSWGWGGKALVKGEEIGEAIKEMMGDESLRLKAAEVKEAARKAIGVGGNSEVTFKTLIDEWKKNNVST